jgi:FAD synthetase
MSLEKLALKYIASAEHALRNMTFSKVSINLSAEVVNRILDLAKAYLNDAKYYVSQKRFEVGLASVAYCEGLLDALKILGAVEFEWPTEGKTKSEK